MASVVTLDSQTTVQLEKKAQENNEALLLFNQTLSSLFLESELTPRSLLPSSVFLGVQAHALLNAQLLWVNLPLFKELGVEIPPTGLSHEMEMSIINAFSFSIARATDDSQLHDSKTAFFYCDRYGGEGLEGNWGSGRAAGVGKIQIKGIGRTPLVGSEVEIHHSHGGISKTEALSEAIWGEVNAHELPYGAVRILALIDPGTSTSWQDSQEPRALIIRENTIRPAHFLSKPEQSTDTIPAHLLLRMQDKTRTKDAIQCLIQTLPQPNSVKKTTQSSSTDLLLSGLTELCRRIAKQSAAAFACGLYHGTTSPSNRTMTAALLDYGTQTYQHGFGKIRILPDVAPAGEDHLENFDTIEQIYNAINNATDLLQSLSNQISLIQLETLFNSTYEEELLLHFLYMTGIPTRHLHILFNESKNQELAKKLLSLATENALPLNVDKQMPSKTTQYDLRGMLLGIHDLCSHSPEVIETYIQSLTHSDQAGSLKCAIELKAFSAELSRFFLESFALATQEGIDAAHFSRLLSLRAREINRYRPDLFRNNMQSKHPFLVEHYQKTKNEKIFSNHINSQISTNIRMTLFNEKEKSYRVPLFTLSSICSDGVVQVFFDAEKKGHQVCAQFRIYELGETTVIVDRTQVIPIERVPLLQVFFRNHLLAEAQAMILNDALSFKSAIFQWDHKMNIQDIRIEWKLTLPARVHSQPETNSILESSLSDIQCSHFSSEKQSLFAQPAPNTL